MKKFLKILKEVGIALAAFLCVIGALAYLFIIKIPIADEIPQVAHMNLPPETDFAVATGGIENAQNETVVYQSTTTDLENYGSELRYISGKTEPLSNSSTSTSDIPTDVINRN
jgi:hypothetical protein